jgi:hypothetical protein
MNRTKEFLTLAPFAALAIAVVYLQGYWGRFDVLAFPYLSFQELLAYSTVPLFGYLFFGLVGVALGLLDSRKSQNKWSMRITTLLFVILCATLIYFDRPEKWLIAPMVAFGLIAHPLLKNPRMSLLIDKDPVLFLVSFVMCLILIGIFGWGRSEAAKVIKTEEPNVRLILDSNTETGKLLGKLGSYYFLLNASNAVIQLPEKAIQRIEYIKKHG